MNHILNIIICSNFYKEVLAAIEAEGLEDIKIVQYPADCGRCIFWYEDKVKSLIQQKGLKEDDTKVLHNISTLIPCQSLLLGETLLMSYMQQGNYIVTPGWLRNWKKYVIDVWGFDGESASTFMNESIKGILLLDSGVYDDLEEELKAFADYVSLEQSILSVGIDYVKTNLRNIYLCWSRNQKDLAIKLKTKKLAHYTLMFDLISELNKMIEVDELINKMLEFFTMFIATTNVVYVRMTNHQLQKIHTHHDFVSGDELEELIFATENEDVSVVRLESSFLLKHEVNENTCDYIIVKDVLLQERMDEYIKMGESIFHVCSLIITNREKFYEAIRVKVELEEENRAKSILIANMSHELRTPINVILSGIQLLESVQDSDTSKNSGYIKMMKQNCFRLIRLINNLIDISKIEANFMGIHKRSVNIVHVVEEIALSVAEYAKGKNIDIEFDTENEEIFLMADVDKIERIMLNLLSNAIKYTSSGGHIYIKVRDSHGDVSISIKDTGIGIPDTKIGQIFERFEQVESTLIRSYEGSGIGLSIVKSFVEMHNGKIKVSSELGRGSEFTIEFPVESMDCISEEAYLPQERSNSLIEILNVEFSDIYFDRVQ